MARLLEPPQTPCRVICQAEHLRGDCVLSSAFSLNSHSPTVDCVREVSIMHSIIYLVGLVVVVLFVLSLLGLH